MFTRAKYLAMSHMDGEAAFRRYYGEIVQAALVTVSPEIVELCRAALAKGDTAFNSIPSQRWDGMWMNDSNANAALKERGDYLTPAARVCILKEAARRQVEALPA